MNIPSRFPLGLSVSATVINAIRKINPVTLMVEMKEASKRSCGPLLLNNATWASCTMLHEPLHQQLYDYEVTSSMCTWSELLISLKNMNTDLD